MITRYHNPANNMIINKNMQSICNINQSIFVNRIYNKIFDRFVHVIRARTSLQLEQMRGVFSNANDVNFFLMIFLHMSLHCKLVDFFEEAYLFMFRFFSFLGFKTKENFQRCGDVIFDILILIIHMKKLLDSDWLRAVQFKCNTSAKVLHQCKLHIVILDNDWQKDNEKY